ncbi:MAG: DNA topoisomerase 4 subunit A [Clostridia bacterium]|nr:DNA topoisomerase 4 subunit A [Clostridia bacterium]
MGKNKINKEQIEGEVYDRTLSEVIHNSMIPYTEYVVMDRALPRVEDGLKPVQRRILYSMLELGLVPEKQYRKSARIVGDCMGKYHPHGDSSVYDAMVRMAQNYSLREPLVDGHGNFGSVDGDSAAAMRYTEAKLTMLSLELLRDLHKNTVSWSLNFDDTLKEPDMLPGRFPNLLVNGSTGIAVGVATNIPPHNLSEVIDGVCAYIKNPKITISELMKYIPGPDFPTGSLMIVGDGLKQAYTNGKGKIILRAKVNIEKNGDKKNIVITELPYQVNKATLLQKIAELRESKKEELYYVGEILDESDRNGMRAVIKVKKDGDVNSILNFLYRNTQMEISFNINMVAIAGGKPKQMGLHEIISYYVDYQKTIIVRRSEFDLKNALARAHILEGLLAAVNQLDLVIALIRKSKTINEAKQNIMEKINLSELQAQAILEIRLARLVNLEILKLEQEYKDLKDLIKNLQEILNSENLQYKLIISELNEIKKRFGNNRKTQVLTENEIAISDSLFLAKSPEKKIQFDNEIFRQPCIVSITADKKIKNQILKNEKVKIKRSGTFKNTNDIILNSLNCFTDTTILIFTNLGNCIKMNAVDLPNTRVNKKGIQIQDLDTKIAFNEQPVKILSISNNDLNTDRNNQDSKVMKIIMFTKQGIIIKIPLADFAINKQFFKAMSVKENDEVINAEYVNEGDIILITEQAYSIRIKTEDFPVQKRMLSGLKSIKLSDDDYVVFAGQCENSGGITIVANSGYAKKVPINNYEIMQRYRKGFKTMSFKNSSDALIYARYDNEPNDIVVESDNELIVIPTNKIYYENRNSKGKHLIKNEFNAIHTLI